MSHLNITGLILVLALALALSTLTLATSLDIRTFAIREFRNGSEVGEGATCTHRRCGAGLTCSGPTPWRRRCIRTPSVEPPPEVGEGDICTHRRCGAGLTCSGPTPWRRRCIRTPIPRGGSCLAAGSVCESGLVCAGTKTNKKCVIPMELGEDCGQDPFWVCIDGLNCVDGMCSSPVVPKGGSCLASGSVCADGLICTGTATKKRCVMPMELNGKCGQDPFWICVSGLDCVDGRCRQPPIAEGGSCTAAGAICADGLLCAGNRRFKRCVRPIAIGGRCGRNPFQICEEGLECINRLCSKPPIPEGGSCYRKGSVCAEGLICSGRRRRMTCRRPAIEAGGSCLAPGSVCERGLVCAGTDSEKLCVEPMRLGEPCEHEPFWVCADYLWCRNGYCRD